MNFSKIMGILVVLLMATTIAFAGTTSDLKNDLKNINDVKNTANISDLKLVNNIKNTITNSELKITNSELKTTNDKKNTSSTNIESTINVMPSTDITNTINSLSSNNRVDLKPNYTVGLVFVDAENLSLIPAESVKITHKYCVGKKCTKETFTPNANPWVANEKVGTHEYIIEAKGHESSSILFNLNKNDVFTQLFLLKPMQKLGKGTFYIIDSKTGQLIDIAKTPVYAIENTCVASNEETKCANKEVIIKENPFTLERVSGTYLYTFSAKGYEDYSSKVQYKVETGFNEKVFLKKATPPEVKGQINIKVVDENGGWINPSLITYNMNICPLIPEPNSTCQGIDNTGVLDNPFSIKTTPQHIYTVEVMVNGYASVKKSYSITGNEVVYDTV
ncbi:MAG: hypothetical protein NTY48_00835 [Candidatus Diapherotrites archaeon]|nr:hypothetical protein [Candidatus Diapherotrites archaeon]